ncbi:hypothetical protein IT570_09775 [Candidatus Sumerlaeota bacterium]|nr:hypothetical protein [Candidatus Sumerlaeota bacterium]
MPRYRFQAIDETGRVVRGVMRANDKDSSREILAGESLHAKTLEEVSEDEKTTWSPRGRIKAMAQGAPAGEAHRESRIVRASLETECIRGLGQSMAGVAGLDDEDRFVFQHDSASAPLLISREEIEQVSISGLMTKVLTIVLVSGKAYEFAVGTVFPHASAKLIASTLAK